MKSVFIRLKHMFLDDGIDEEKLLNGDKVGKLAASDNIDNVKKAYYIMAKSRTRYKAIVDWLTVSINKKS